MRSSAARSGGSRTGRSSPDRAASPPTSISPASSTCASCARRSRTAASSASTRRRRWRCRASSRSGLADVAEIPPIDFRQVRVPGLEPYRQPVLATGKVRYVGEPVAVVFAEDRLPCRGRGRAGLRRHRGPAAASTPTPAGEFDDGRSTEPAVIRKGYGDVDAAFARRMPWSSSTLAIGRHTGVPLETRGAIARYDAARGVLEIHGAAKVPHWQPRQARRACSACRRRQVHLYEGHVGGGFGIRGELYPEDVLVCARRAPPRPAGQVDRGPARASHRRQPFARAGPPHPRRGRRATASSSRIDDEFFPDQGAYVRTHAATVPDLTAAMLPGPYRRPGLSRRRPHPPDQQDARAAPTARPAATRAPSSASG